LRWGLPRCLRIHESCELIAGQVPSGRQPSDVRGHNRYLIHASTVTPSGAVGKSKLVMGRIQDCVSECNILNWALELRIMTSAQACPAAARPPRRLLGSALRRLLAGLNKLLSLGDFSRGDILRD
jgi:hypothetical protein